MKCFRLSAIFCVLGFGSAVFAAPPHSVTYTPTFVAPGTTVTIQGTQFVAVALGIREFTANNRYVVRFLSPLYESQYVSAVVEARHSTDPLPNPNATIDSFPAQIEVSDGRSYAVNTDFDPNTFELTNRLQVTASATLVVQVKVGDTLLIGTVSLTHLDQDDDLGANNYKANTSAKYGKYSDPTGLINGLDRWIDYVRVIPIN